MSNFKNEILSSHNKYRKDHGAPALKWSSKLESSAQNWANHLAKKSYLQHDQQNEYGENLACMQGSELTGTKTTDMWYNEIKDYNFNKPGYNSKTGHFTQVVWVSSEEIGVGKAVASNGMQFVVARYNPAGNNLRTFKENVFPRGSSPKKSPGSNSIDDKKVEKKVDRNKKNKSKDREISSIDNSTSSTGRQNNNDFKKTLLRTHNQYRKRHGSVPLKWNKKLEEKAQEAAEEVAKTNTLKSVDIQNVGQNMAAMTGGELTGEKVSTMWYEEESNYNYNSPGFSPNTGSFTQMIWKGSTQIGVGRAFGSSGQSFVIALYQAPGNIRGKYEENVDRPNGPLPGKDQGCKCTIL